MSHRRNDFDVTDRVRTTDPGDVRAEVARIRGALYDGEDSRLPAAFEDAQRIYAGEYPGYQACDTAYHNLQHVLDVTLAMARLMDGYERGGREWGPLGERLFRFGVVLALFHDVGYVRRQHDRRHANGAEYTLTHVSRGAVFLDHYLDQVELGDLKPLARRLVHFTGYEMPVDRIRVSDPLMRRLGAMLGSADIIAQMSDRCYLEKCRDRLYPEFVLGGVAVQSAPDGSEQVLFASGEDLLRKTPGFYRKASTRLEQELAGAYRYAERHFEGQNLYLEELQKNIRHAQRLDGPEGAQALRRTPPPAGFESVSSGSAPGMVARRFRRLAA